METVLITGCSRGIGLELACQFLEGGYKVIATYRNTPSETLQALSQDNPNLQLAELEVSSAASIEKLAQTLADTPIDILINNAGISGPEAQNLNDIDVDGWLETFKVNSISPLLVSQALIANLTQSSNPRIITISSQMGSMEHQGVGRYAYRTSKAAVNKVMHVLSQELREQGIIVCPVHPGWVQTDMGGKNGELTPEQSAEGIIKLIKDLRLEQSGEFFMWNGDKHPW